MKYPHIVCINGNWIPAGTEIPDVKDKDFSKVSKVVEVEKEPLPFEPKTYTKTEINRMSTDALRKLAKEEGIPKAKDMSGSALKSALIEKFGL